MFAPIRFASALTFRSSILLSQFSGFRPNLRCACPLIKFLDCHSASALDHPRVQILKLSASHDSSLSTAALSKRYIGLSCPYKLRQVPS